MARTTTDPRMFDTDVTIDGIHLRVDRIDRKRTEGSDNVMAIFWEEQPFTWRFIQPHIIRALKESPGSLGFLDVGTGSGIFGIWMAKHLGASVVAIDKSARAIARAKQNARRNGVKLQYRFGRYQVGSVPRQSAKVIGLYPPYHLYPQSIAPAIPQHARGGSDGQDEFRNQLHIANTHLAPNGVIFFNQMCLGTDRGPRFLDYIPKLIGGRPSIVYTNVFPRIRTRAFLRGVYGERHHRYVEATSKKYPWLYYAVGIIRRDGQGAVQEVKHRIPLRGRTWKDRIVLHQEISGHADR